MADMDQVTSTDHVIYRVSSGEIVRTFAGPEADVAHQLVDGEAALPGTGSWLTHRVVDGQVIALSEPRRPPFDGARFDFDSGLWFDPLQRAETAAAARRELRDRIAQRIAGLEARQHRPLREIEIARALGASVPAAAVAVLQELESQVAGLRAQLAGLS